METKKILFLTAVLLISSTKCMALTVSESTSEQYLMNHGYSKETARLVDLKHKQINGEPVVNPYENTDLTTRQKLIRNVQTYTDPAVDEGDFGNTKIKDIPPAFAKKSKTLYEKAKYKIKSYLEDDCINEDDL